MTYSHNPPRGIAPTEDEPPVSWGAASESLRGVMRWFATGITVLTTAGPRCHGMTANSFASVSLNPPLVLCCVSNDALMNEAIMSSGRFAVSILGADQEHLARYFTDHRRPRGRAQFDAVDWEPGSVTGAPILGGALAWLECSLHETLVAGDHSVFVGKVLASAQGDGDRALLFYGARYHQFGLPYPE
jgi:flavin reductase (DIM6/NTAB) family NADH-FMN oxidoreductase RutF